MSNEKIYKICIMINDNLEFIDNETKMQIFLAIRDNLDNEIVNLRKILNLNAYKRA